MHYCLCENGEYKKYTKKQRAKYNDNLPKYCFQNYKWGQSLVKNYFLSFRQLSHFPNNSFFSSCIVLRIPTSLKQRNRTFFPFHSPLALFWVNSCFPFDILRTYWITCIFWVRDVINCLRWLWTSAWGCGGVWIKCENWSDTCFITNALLEFRLLVIFEFFLFWFQFYHFRKPCSPDTFISAYLLNSAPMLFNTVSFMFACPIRPLNWR